VNSSCHIITTVRNKIETAQVDWKVKKVWTKELTREGFEYELTVNFNVERDSHNVTASKDRTWMFIDRDPFLITKKTWEEIIEWNKSWKIAETLEEKQSKKFNLVFDEIKTCIDKKTMQVIFDNLREEVKNNSKLLSKEQLWELWSLKKDMIASFEQKSEWDTKKLDK